MSKGVILFIIIIIFLIINKYKLLLENTNYLNFNNFIINDDYSYLLKKYSSINFDINDFLNKSFYYNIIETTSTLDEKRIIELILNDINKTKINNNYNILNNIYLIIKKINDNIRIIIFYDGILYNNIIFNENDFSNRDLVYKLNMNDKLFNHYLQ